MLAQKLCRLMIYRRSALLRLNTVSVGSPQILKVHYNSSPPKKGRFEQVSIRQIGLLYHQSVLLQENIATIPNALSLGRIVLSPALGYLVVSNHFTAALGLFVVTGLSDVVM